MALLTKNTGSANADFQPAPEGDFQGVVADVVDLGYIEKTFQGTSQGLKPHVQIVYQIGGVDAENEDVMRDDGKPYLVFGRRYVLSMNERAGFYKEICGILGKKKVDELCESGELDTEDLIGKNVNIVIVHNEGTNGQTYANIESLKPWNPRHGDLVDSRDYDRRHERDNYEAPEFSAFGPGPDASAKPKTESSKPPKRDIEHAPLTQPDKHDSKSYAKALVKGETPQSVLPKSNKANAEPYAAPVDDEEDPFADS